MKIFYLDDVDYFPHLNDDVLSKDVLYDVCNSYLQYTDIPSIDFSNFYCTAIIDDDKTTYSFVSNDEYNIYSLNFSFFSKKVDNYYSVHDKKYGLLDNKRNNYIDEEVIKYTFLEDYKKIKIYREYVKEFANSRNNNHLSYSLVVYVDFLKKIDEWNTFMLLDDKDLKKVKTKIKKIKYNKLING